MIETFPSITPAYPFVRSPSYVVDVVSSGRYEQRLLRTPTPRYTYTAHWPVLTDAEKVLLQTFFLARQGNLESFYYTDPDPDSETYGDPLTVRFVQSAMNFEYFTYQLWNMNRVEMISAD